jgi:hypothetical protein
MEVSITITYETIVFNCTISQRIVSMNRNYKDKIRFTAVYSWWIKTSNQPAENDLPWVDLITGYPLEALCREGQTHNKSQITYLTTI